jgi:hypothetical protein
MIFALFVVPSVMGTIKLLTPFIEQLADARDLHRGVAELPEMLLTEDEQQLLRKQCAKEFARGRSRVASLQRAKAQLCCPRCTRMPRELFTQRELATIAEKAGKMLQMGAWRSDRIRMTGVPICTQCDHMESMN